jgi:ElaA protein
MDFSVKHFDSLSSSELVEMYRLRAEVFIVEQDCPYQDLDGKDECAYHVFIKEGDVLVGYSRLLPPGAAYPEPSIGRVVVEKKYRRSGTGRALMEYSVARTVEFFNPVSIVISAQTYLLTFYATLGFIAEGDPYDEDGIPHMQMRYGITGSSG